MASIYDLKSTFQDLLHPVMSRLRGMGVTPNGLTLAAFLLSAVVGGVLIWKPIPPLLLLLPVWLFLRMALNALDGMMAREYDLQSDVGAFLNELGDVLSDLALYLPLVVFVPDSPVVRWSIVGFGIGAVLTEFCGVLPQTIGGSRHYEGPVGKSDRAFGVGALALGGAFYPASFHWWGAFFLIADLGMIITCWRRLSHGLPDQDEGEQTASGEESGNESVSDPDPSSSAEPGQEGAE